ncbi:NAD-dependent epimerase/dehydratase family protein [Shimia sp. W99]
MNGPIAITGATGFVGQHTVAYARLIDLPLRVIVRAEHSVPRGWVNDPGVDIREADLAESTNISSDLKGASAVIHAAATLAGDHARDTIAASENLIAAIVEAGVPHVVLVSSLSVYDVTTLRDNDILTEACPLAETGRDAYAAAKLSQEHMFRAAAQEHGLTLSILRPGAIYGPDRLFNAHIGPGIGPALVMIDGGGKVPLCHVDLAAECLIRAAQSPNGIEAINLFDDALPSRDRFVTAFRRTGWPRLVLHLPLGMARLLARITPNGASMPGLLRRDTLEARHKPLSYANTMMHKRLNPVTMLPFETAMSGSIGIEQDRKK